MDKLETENADINVLDLVGVGQIVYIESPKCKSKPFGVYNILNHELVVCQPLGKKLGPSILNPEDTVTMVVPEKSGGAYMIKAAVVEINHSSGRIIFCPTHNIDHIQRRRHFRLDKPTAKANYQIIGQDSADTPPVEGIVWDLSGSGIGLLIKTAKTIKAHTQLRLIISLSEEEPIEVIGVVVRVIPKNIIRNEYLLGICFDDDTDEKDRSSIVRFVAKEQLVRRNLDK